MNNYATKTGNLLPVPANAFNLHVGDISSVRLFHTRADGYIVKSVIWEVQIESVTDRTRTLYYSGNSPFAYSRPEPGIVMNREEPEQKREVRFRYIRPLSGERHTYDFSRSHLENRPFPTVSTRQMGDEELAAEHIPAPQSCFGYAEAA